MERIVHDLIPDSPEWHAFRLDHDGASEAAAMLGLSKTITRTELLHMKATGLPREFSDFVQSRVLDKGKDVEARARPIAAEIIGSPLYPATCSIGRTSASCDGLDMGDEFAWEHKLINQKNGPIVRAGQVPEEHMPQCQQVLMVTGAKRLLFMVSNGTRANLAHVWVEPDTNWFDRLRAGWVQFNLDRAAYAAPEATDPAPSGRAPESLPALHIEVTGMVTASNLAAFKDNALAVFGGINRELTTDAQFADAEKTVKWCADVEERLAAAKQHALSQTASIDELFRTIDDISAEARRVRLELDKLVKARKEAIRGEILAAGVSALRGHIDSLNTRLGKPYMPPVHADFGGAIKGKRTVDSLRDAVSTTLANAKIEASAIADKIQINLATLREFGKDHVFLFADTAQIVLKAPDDLTMLVKSRIAMHQQAEEKRLEFEREKIRAEEQAKAEKDARDNLAREAEEQRLANEATARATAAAELAAAKASPEDAEPSPIAQTLNEQDGADRFSAAHPSAASYPNVVQMRQPVQAAPPALKLGEINARLAPIQLSADGLRALGFEIAATDRTSKLYHEASFTHICAALVKHINSIQATQAA